MLRRYSKTPSITPFNLDSQNLSLWFSYTQENLYMFFWKQTLLCAIWSSSVFIKAVMATVQFQHGRGEEIKRRWGGRQSMVLFKLGLVHLFFVNTGTGGERRLPPHSLHTISKTSAITITRSCCPKQ